MLNDLNQALYLIADEMRGLASLSRAFSANPYELERAERLMELAARVAGLTDDTSFDQARAVFSAEPWLRYSPAIGVDAAVFNADGEILLIQRTDAGQWAMPGGLAEIGQSPAEAVLRELWEEVGLRGRVSRLIGAFDGRYWGSKMRVHLIHLVFSVECENLTPAPGTEAMDARFFPPNHLPTLMYAGHGERVPKCIELHRSGDVFFDPHTSFDTNFPAHQRP